MNTEMICQGRRLTAGDILFIREIIRANPSWNRTRISREICQRWNWVTPYGQVKDMAARTMLLKMHRKNLIKLPPSRGSCRNAGRGKIKTHVEHDRSPVKVSLGELTPISIVPVKGGHSLKLFKTCMESYHYLGLKTVVGENIKYMVCDKNQRVVAFLLFGAAAWSLAARDAFIGWDNKTREKNLLYVIGNSRFLILPWVIVPHLASHVLGRIARRISDDWQSKYAHPVYLLETFVNKDKFKGTCYRAANWIYAGDTKGRGKKDRHKRFALPVKSIWLYPLVKDFRKYLGGLK
jgi:hypothetical protein